MLLMKTLSDFFTESKSDVSRFTLIEFYLPFSIPSFFFYQTSTVSRFKLKSCEISAVIFISENEYLSVGVMRKISSMWYFIVQGRQRWWNVQERFHCRLRWRENGCLDEICKIYNKKGKYRGVLEKHPNTKYDQELAIRQPLLWSGRIFF